MFWASVSGGACENGKRVEMSIDSFERLLIRYQSGEATSAELAAFAKALRADPAYRRRLVDAFLVEVQLRNAFNRNIPLKVPVRLLQWSSDSEKRNPNISQLHQTVPPAEGIASEIEWRTNEEAAIYLGCSRRTVVKLIEAQILKPEFNKLRGRFGYHHRESDLLSVNLSLATNRQLMEKGCAKPVDGKLLVLVKNTQSDSQSPSHLPLDLCVEFPTSGSLYVIKAWSKKSGNPRSRYIAAIKNDVFLEKVSQKLGVARDELKAAFANGEFLETASKKLRVSKLRLKFAVANPSLKGIFMYGGNFYASLESNLREFDRETKISTSIDREKFKCLTEFFDVVHAKTLGERLKVSQCFQGWIKLGLLREITIRAEIPGVVPSKYGMVNDKKVPIEWRNIKKNEQQTLVDVKTFVELWERDLHEYAEKVRKWIGSGSMSAKQLRADLEEEGIVDWQYREVVRLAGADLENHRPGEPFVYSIMHRGPTPKKRRQRKGETVDYLAEELRKGPVLVAAAYLKARVEKRNTATLSRAAKTLGCKSIKFSVPPTIPGKRHGGILAFWYLPKAVPDRDLPEQQPPTRRPRVSGPVVPTHHR